MTKNPFINAGAAAAYIATGVLVGFTLGPQLHMVENTVAMPILMLSLLVMSVAVMGYLFFFTPTTLLIEGKREEALRLFLSTVGLFGAFVVALVALLLIFLK